MSASLADVKTIFGKALELRGEAERATFLAEACGGDAQLRAEVESLLQAQVEAGSFLRQRVPPPAATLNQPPVERPGAVLGPYKLLEQIGEGGMGTVFVAQQSEPLKRLVALKIIKAGMDSRQVIARFEGERQALALMDHPNIAKVLDAGTTAAGRPYFVMELVKGVPITEYCDQHHLTPKERLELFVPVCQAIQHAHQKGIIHRDLKPSNVLVALYDDRPVPKIIDFGVAKATGQQLTEQTLHTGFGTVVGTLEYMSPEQATFNQLDVDTRSDVYSLGILLYELLAGSPPFTRKELERAGMLEMLRVIREEEPSKPSIRLSSSDALPTLSANRGTEPAKLTRLVRGELDWIVMKALEKDRSRRYETANGFAMDVQRYLADEPVLACPPSALYRFRKYVRRNKSGLAVAVLVLFFLVLLGGGAGWAWRDRAARAVEQATHLERAVDRAELLQREGKRGEALAALERARLLAREAEPAPPMAERIASLQQLLDAEGRDEVFVARFEAIRREVQTEVDFEQSAFRSREAYPKWREALEHHGIAVGVTPPAAVVTHIQKRPAAIQTILVAGLDECFARVSQKDSREWLIDVLGQADNDPWRNKVRRAWKEPATLEALARDIDVRQQPPSFLLLLARALPIESPSRLELEQRVQFAYPGDFWANHNLAFDLHRAGKHAAAIRYYTAALSLRPDNPGVLLNRANALKGAGELEAAIADLQRAIVVAPRYAMAYYNLGIALSDQEKLDEAIDAYKKAIKIDPQFASAYSKLAIALRRQGKLDQAIDAFRKVLEIDPKDAEVYHSLGITLSDQGTPDEAIDAFRKAIEINPQMVEVYISLSHLYRNEKKLDEAIDACHKAIAIDPRNAMAYNNLGCALHDQKKLPDAIAALHQAIELDPRHPVAHVNLGNALRDQKKLDDAIAAYRKAIELDPKYVNAHYNLGNVLSDQKKLDDAIAAYHKAIELDPNDAGTHYNLGNALRDQKKLDDAVAAYHKAIELDPKYVNAHYNLGNVLSDQEKLDEAIAAYHKAIEFNPKDANVYDNLGNALFRQGKLDEAIDAYRKATKIDPNHARAHLGLGFALYRRGNLKEAVEAYQKAIEIDPTDAGAHGNLGLALQRQGRLDEAIAACRKAIQLDPTRANAHSILGSCLMGQDKVDEAITSLRQAIELDPKHEIAHHNLGDAFYRKGEFDESIASLRKALDLDPQFASAHYGVGIALKAQGKPDEAIPSLRKAIELDPKLVNAHFALGDALSQQKQWDDAMLYFRKAIELATPDELRALNWALNNAAWRLATHSDPELRNPTLAVELARKAVELSPSAPHFRCTLGTALYRAGDWKASIAELEKTNSLRKPDDPMTAYSDFFLALAHWQLVEKDQAREWFDKAEQSMEKHQPKNEELRRFRAEAAALLGLPNPDPASALFEQVRILRDQKKFAEAETALREVIRIKPALIAAHAMLGWMLQSQGKFPEMEAAFRDLLRLKPDDAEGQHGLGRALLHQKKFGDAIAPLREAIRLGSTDHWVYDGLGWALVEQGQFAEAETAFQEVVRLKRDLVNGHSGLGRALAEQKKFAEAEAAFREAVRLNPNLVSGGYAGLGRALVDQKKFAEAEEVLRKALDLEPTHPWASELLGRALVGQGKFAEAEELKKKSEPKPSQTKEKPE